MSTATRSSYLGRLHYEWQTELAHRPAADPDGTPWALGHPTLAGPHTLEGLLAVISASEGEDTDAVLHALLCLAHDGRTDAARTVLQTMLPTVRRQGLTARYRRLEDPLSCAGAAMWTAIATYPLRRTRAVAANLALEALHHLDADASLTPTPVGISSAPTSRPTSSQGTILSRSPPTATPQPQLSPGPWTTRSSPPTRSASWPSPT